MDEKSADWFKKKRQAVEGIEYDVGVREGEKLLLKWEDLDDYNDSDYFFMYQIFRTFRNGLGLPKSELNKNFFWVVDMVNLFTEEDLMEENYQTKLKQKTK